jgi:electron transfer flavoprotein alpha subunit
MAMRIMGGTSSPPCAPTPIADQEYRPWLGALHLVAVATEQLRVAYAVRAAARLRDDVIDLEARHPQVGAAVRVVAEARLVAEHHSHFCRRHLMSLRREAVQRAQSSEGNVMRNEPHKRGDRERYDRPVGVRGSERRDLERCHAASK